MESKNVIQRLVSLWKDKDKKNKTSAESKLPAVVSFLTMYFAGREERKPIDYEKEQRAYIDAVNELVANNDKPQRTEKTDKLLKLLRAVHDKYVAKIETPFYRVMNNRKLQVRSDDNLLDAAKDQLRDEIFQYENDKMELSLLVESSNEPEKIDDLIKNILTIDRKITVTESNIEVIERQPEPDRPLIAMEDVEDVPMKHVLSVCRDGKRWGSFLQEGQIAVFAGAGGGGKTTIAAQIAVETAAAKDGEDVPILDQTLVSRGGPVLYVVHEDDVSAIKKKMEMYIKHSMSAANPVDYSAAWKRVYFLNLKGRPLYGPIRAKTGAAHYTAEPGPLEAGRNLWRVVEECKPVMIIIDPALGAFSANLIDAAPVRKFLMWLAVKAEEAKTSVFLLAHSNKSARGRQITSIYDPGTVSGSTQWLDTARGVISVSYQKDKKGNRVGSSYLLAMVKANHGPAYMYATLEPLFDNEQNPLFFGMECVTGVEGNNWEKGNPPQDDEETKTKKSGGVVTSDMEECVDEEEILNST